MAYTKNTWNNGDIITAEKLNHMEDGIGSAVFMVEATYDETTDTTTLNKTWQEIHNALKTGLVLIRNTSEDSFVTLEFVGITYIDATYWIESIGMDGSVYVGQYSTDSPSGYPLRFFSEG